MAMITRVLSSALIAVLALPLLATGQEQSPLQSQHELRLTRKREVILLPPSRETAVQDAERASKEIAEAARLERLIRESRGRALSRPDLDYSIVSGIQARNVQRALRR